jgi:hypothetical protein
MYRGQSGQTDLGEPFTSRLPISKMLAGEGAHRSLAVCNHASI